MQKIGIDIGSTFTKYCIMDEQGNILELFTEKTPVRQNEFFAEKLTHLKQKYPCSEIISCGYGKKNISAIKNINELTALAAGVYNVMHTNTTVLDIGGQDTKIICQESGRLKTFFINDKCAAGSGLFLINVCKLLETDLSSVSLTGASEPEIKLSSVCAVFAQSEIINLLSDNVPPQQIIQAAIWQLLTQAKRLLSKVEPSDIVLSGGLTHISGICEFARLVFDRKCIIPDHSSYLSAIGCSVYR